MVQRHDQCGKFRRFIQCCSFIPCDICPLAKAMAGHGSERDGKLSTVKDNDGFG